MTITRRHIRLHHPALPAWASLLSTCSRWGRLQPSYLLGRGWAAAPGWLRRLAVGQQLRLKLGRLSLTVRW